MDKTEIVFRMLRHLMKLVPKDVPPTETLVVFSEVLAKRYELEKLATTFEECALTHNSFPTLAQIAKIASPAVDDKGLAVTMASTIIAAIGVFGSYRAIEAEASLGPVLWTAVKMAGGWGDICTRDRKDDHFYVHIRERCHAVLNGEAINVALDQRLLHFDKQKSSTKKLNFDGDYGDGKD